MRWCTATVVKAIRKNQQSWTPTRMYLLRHINHHQVTKLRTFQSRSVKPSHFYVCKHGLDIYLFITEMVQVDDQDREHPSRYAGKDGAMVVHQDVQIFRPHRCD